jgi:hypothetical protein
MATYVLFTVHTHTLTTTPTTTTTTLIFYSIDGLIESMRKGGNEVVAVVKSRVEVMKMLEHVVLSEQMTKNKAAGKLMSKVEKVAKCYKLEEEEQAHACGRRRLAT